jgi:hypothetical protein
MSEIIGYKCKYKRNCKEYKEDSTLCTVATSLCPYHRVYDNMGKRDDDIFRDEILTRVNRARIINGGLEHGI